MEAQRKRLSLSSRELDVINKSARVLSGNLNFQESSKELLKVLYSFWDAKLSFVFVYGDSPKGLRVVAQFGADNLSQDLFFKRGEGPVGKAYKDGIPIVLHTLKEFDRSIRELLEGDETFIAVPIRAGGDIVGVLAVFKKFEETESVEKGVELLLILGTMMGMVYKLEEKLQEERKEWEDERKELTKALEERYSLEGIVGRSGWIKNLATMIEKVADTDITVLITGESGTGKSLVAKAIHFMSRRREKPFITINCSAIPETLLEAELFGYEKGAFTGAYTSRKGKFELANGGTIFLDEVGDLPLSLQPKLLRVLQEKEIEPLGSERSVKVDVRVVCATNKDLKDLISKGLFREDLYYRISAFPVHIPPLRERKEDIPLLVEHFLNIFNQRYNKKVRISPKALDVMTEYAWYGNVRELENTIERLVILCDNVIKVEDLPSYFLSQKKEEKPMPELIEGTEREAIIKALEKTGYVKSRAAKLLGYTLRQLDYRIKKYRIEIKGF